MPLNKTRVNRARALLNCRFASLEEEIIDVLSDLRHLCFAEGIDFNALNGISLRHFDTENKEQQG